MTNVKKGYELFLPAVAAAIGAKEKSDDQLTNPELRRVVKVTFRDAVIKFMRDSLLYRIELPIDLYTDVRRYDLIPPDNYLIVDVIGFNEHKTTIPPNNFNNKSITLNCCPVKDVERAFFAEVALQPMRSHNCEFDIEFLEMYYDAILANMFFRLTSMPQRQWRLLGASRAYQRDYIIELNKAKRRALAGGDAIKIRTKRLSEYVSSC